MEFLELWLKVFGKFKNLTQLSNRTNLSHLHKCHELTKRFRQFSLVPTLLIDVVVIPIFKVFAENANVCEDLQHYANRIEVHVAILSYLPAFSKTVVI